jgi:hypothetical protein
VNLSSFLLHPQTPFLGRLRGFRSGLSPSSAAASSSERMQNVTSSIAGKKKIHFVPIRHPLSRTCILFFPVLYLFKEIQPPIEFMIALEKYSLLRDIEKRW